MKLKAFLSGDAFDAYTYFGAHTEPGGVVFRVYAPQASRVTLEGDFNGWQEWDASGMQYGIWVFHVPNARHGQNYKYCIYSKRGKRTERADPYGFGMGLYGCSVIRDLDSYLFQDGEWMEHRTLQFDRPMSVYELHLPSWKRQWGHYLSYEAAAEELIACLRENHYTHVEFLPLNEHPMDGSWGYQATGFFSPSGRFGEGWQLMYLIDRLHQAGFGAILDFVTVHFAVDHYSLHMFDGSALYESSKPGNRRSDWGSYFFEHTRGEVRSFLKSAADYWLSVYHFDGLRFDAVSHLIYGHGEAQYGENPGGLAFLREINQGLEARHPTAMRIAEDATAYPGVTHRVSDGGLGFHYKWAMGWSYDTLGYFQLPPEQRFDNSRRLTFALDYFSTERFVLPVSHDMQGGSGRAFLSRFPGPYRDQLRNAKLFYLFMTVHPGKKLLFLGSELGTFTAWNALREVDRYCLYDEKLAPFRQFCNDLNNVYLSSPALYEADDAPWSARWVCCEPGAFALIRHSGNQHMLLVMNPSGQDWEHWFPLEGAADVKLRLHTQWSLYGGRVARKETCIWLENGWVGVRLPRLSGLLAEITFS